jgi:hypothetical protein
MPLGTQYFALASGNPDGTDVAGGDKVVANVMVSDHFQDPEGRLDLVYTLADLSDDDKKIVDVFLTDVAPTITDNDFDEDPTHAKNGLTGTAILAIRAKAKGSVTLTLTVKDGLPDGMTTHPIPVMVRATNAPPGLLDTVWTSDAYAKLSRTDEMRLTSTEVVTMDVPSGGFVDNDGDSLKVTAEIIGNDAAAHKELLGVSIDAAGDLVLTAKKGGPATGDIIVQISATDPFGKAAMTGTSAPTAIAVRVNTPPMHPVYTSSDTIPTGKKEGDKRMLADIADKTFSVSADTPSGEDAVNEFIGLTMYFADPDTEDSITGANGICDFSTDQPTGDGAYALVKFNDDRDNIGVRPLKSGTFQLTVTCTDGKKESLTDSVTVTIRQ